MFTLNTTKQHLGKENFISERKCLLSLNEGKVKYKGKANRILGFWGPTIYALSHMFKG